jgi:hypothetical protein
MDEHDEIEINLRQPREVAKRIIVLGTVLRRLALEHADRDSEGDAAEEAFDLRAWLSEQELDAALTLRESDLLAAPVGTLDPGAVAETSWQGEGLAAIAWAAGITGRLGPADSADVADLLQTLPMPWDETASFVARANLAPETDIAHAREAMDLCHWRISAEALRRVASAADRREYDMAIRETAAEAAAAGLITATPEGDFAIAGQDVSSLSSDEIDRIIAVSGERLRALNWLCGFGASWDDVPLDI